MRSSEGRVLSPRAPSAIGVPVKYTLQLELWHSPLQLWSYSLCEAG